MRTLIDEQLSHTIASSLREQGFDAIAVTDRRELVGSDEEVMRIALGEDRAVVTNKVKDFRPIATAAVLDGTGHPGLVLLPATRSRTTAAVDALVASIADVMRAHPDGIHDSEHWITSS